MPLLVRIIRLVVGFFAIAFLLGVLARRQSFDLCCRSV